MIVKRILTLALALSLSFSAASAATRETGAFLKVGVGARAMGLGDAFTAVSDDGTAFYWNPAGLSLVRKRELSAMYSGLFGISEPLAGYHSVSILQPLAVGEASVSLGWIRLSINDIPKYPELQGGRNGGSSRWGDPGLQGDGQTDDAERGQFESSGQGWQIPGQPPQGQGGQHTGRKIDRQNITITAPRNNGHGHDEDDNVGD